MDAPPVELPRLFFGAWPALAVALQVIAVLLGLGLLGAFWLLWGPEARRRRVARQAAELLKQGAWQEALEEVQRLRRIGRPSMVWQMQAAGLEGRCHERAGDDALRQRSYESALEHYARADRLMERDARESRARVVGQMLADVRRLFAGSADVLPAASDMAHRVLAVEPGCAEALFWQALCYVRQEQDDSAAAYLRAARDACGAKIFDPSLYLGALLLRHKKPKEAWTFAAEASRLVPSNAFAAWAVGMAIAQGGTETVALGPLRRALRPDGLLRWWNQPRRAWVEGMPDPAHSFVARLSAEHPYSCPVMGDIRNMILRGQRAMARVQLRRGRYDRAAQLYQAILQSVPPTGGLLRGLGLSLARLGRYAEAYPALRDAHRLRPNDYRTAGHLALCMARVRKDRPDKRTRYVSRALRVLEPFDVRGDPEWADLCGAVLAEAREAAVPVPAANQLRLCDALASVDAVDPAAAEAYHALMAAAPKAVRPEHAWLYARAAQLHDLRLERELDLFARAFQDRAAAEQFFSRHGWETHEIELAYLKRQASRRPGAFPEILGPDYPARAEADLLALSQREEQEQHLDRARATAEVWLALAPDSPRAHDRLASLCYRAGDVEQTAGLLARWHTFAADDPTPLVRLAALEARRGHAEASAAAMRQALGQAAGARRAALAFLGGQLVLRALVAPPSGQAAASVPASLPREGVTQAAWFFARCLKDDPGHRPARRWLAIAHWILGDPDGLAAEAALGPSGGTDPRTAYLEAIRALVAGDELRAIEAANRAAVEPALAVDSTYLAGLARLRAGMPEQAAGEFRKILEQAPEGRVARQARALLGNIAFGQGAYQEALAHWVALESSTRTAWGVDEALRQTALLAGLVLLRKGQPEPAAELMAQAARLGVPCQPLVNLARLKAAQRLLSAPAPEDAGPESDRLRAGVQLLEQILRDSGPDRSLTLQLAAAYHRLGAFADERRVLQTLPEPDGLLRLQMGRAALWEGKLDQAEEEFQKIWQTDPSSYDACHHLLMTRLSAGRMEDTDRLAKRAAGLAPFEDDRRLFRLLHALLRSCLAPEGISHFDSELAEMSAGDERRLLDLIRSTGNPGVNNTLLETLLAMRMTSVSIREALLEVVLLRAKRAADRGQWGEAYRLLMPPLRERKAPGPLRTALLNMAGCCAYVAQHLSEAAALFQAAREVAGPDPRVRQNLALTFEGQGSLDEAEACWNEYLDTARGQVPVPPGWAGYLDRLIEAGLLRLADGQTRQARWSEAAVYAQRAHQLRPDDPEPLERLVAIYRELDRKDDARRCLSLLRQLKPAELRYQIGELDLLRIKQLDDVDRLAAELDRILNLSADPTEMRERAAGVVGQAVAFLTAQSQRLSDEFSRLLGRRHALQEGEDPGDLVESMDFLRVKLQRLKKSVDHCLPLVDVEEHGRLRELSRHLQRQAEACRFSEE